MLAKLFGPAALLVLTALMVFAARIDAPPSAVADVNHRNADGSTPLQWAVYKGDVAEVRRLLDDGADPNLANEYGASPMSLAAEVANTEILNLLLASGADADSPNQDGQTALMAVARTGNVAAAKALLEHGANPNARIRDNTLTRTIFTMQWFFEDGATAFVRAAQSSDTELMKLLLQYRADPFLATGNGDTALTAAGGIGWVEGVTYERSPQENVEALRMLLDLGLDPNGANREGRTALMGAALKGRNAAVQLLVDRGAKLEIEDRGSRDTDKLGSAAAGHRWQALDYAEGLVRVGVQSATAYPETAALIRTLMRQRGLPVPPENRNILSICVVSLCQ